MQPFVWIFTEVVDWSGGDDAQFRRIVPLTPAEEDALTRAGQDVNYDSLPLLGRGRRYLRMDWPTGHSQPETCWASGDFPYLTYPAEGVKKEITSEECAPLTAGRARFPGRMAG